MQDSTQRHVLTALLVALKPIARMLLRNGIGFREFAEISKSAFVDTATNDYGLRGRPTNISRVAVMTGLTRKEVRRIRDKIDQGNESVVAKSTPLADILHRWYSVADFLDTEGRPLSLAFDGDTPCFSDLVRRYGGDIPPGAMRTELKRVGAITEQEDGKLRPIKRYVSASDSQDKLVTGLVRGIYPVASAVAHNTDPNLKSETWIQRTASTNHVRDEDMPRIRRISHDRLVEFTEAIDDLYVAYETLHGEDVDVRSGADTDASEIGVGVFYFENHAN